MLQVRQLMFRSTSPFLRDTPGGPDAFQVTAPRSHVSGLQSTGRCRDASRSMYKVSAVGLTIPSRGKDFRLEIGGVIPCKSSLELTTQPNSTFISRRNSPRNNSNPRLDRLNLK